MQAKILQTALNAALMLMIKEQVGLRLGGWGCTWGCWGTVHCCVQRFAGSFLHTVHAPLLCHVAVCCQTDNQRCPGRCPHNVLSLLTTATSVLVGHLLLLLLLFAVVLQVHGSAAATVRAVESLVASLQSSPTRVTSNMVKGV
jgi:hypothetical protein